MTAGETPASPASPVPERLTGPYLELMKRCLTRGSFRRPTRTLGDRRWLLYSAAARVASRFGFDLVRPVNPAAQRDGRDHSSDAETVIGSVRLDNLQACVTDVLERRIPGDLIETGVWRGGASIFMRAVLSAYGITDRRVWLADSFRGLPKPDPDRYPADAGDRFWRVTKAAVPLEDVKSNFESYRLLDDQVQFLVGWFSETLPSAPIEALAVLRLDGDMYESTMDALKALYARLSVGGYVIVDDYGAVPGCRQAVQDFRADNRIADEIHPIDWTGVFWQRQS